MKADNEERMPREAEGELRALRIRAHRGIPLEGALIVIAAAGIAWNAVGRLLHPQPLHQAGAGLALAGLASVINFAVARVLFRVGRRHHSVALESDAQHLMTDVWTSVVVCVAVALVVLSGWTWLDPALGL